MGLIFCIYLVVIVCIMSKGVTISWLCIKKTRCIVTAREKDIIKSYYGALDLAKEIESYRRKVAHDLILAAPLPVIGALIDPGLLLFGLLMVVLLSRLRYMYMKKEVKRRKVEFFREYPGFLNCLRLYMQAGLTLENALALCFEGTSPGFYLNLVSESLTRISLGTDRREAFLGIVLRTRERELIKLTSFFIQFYMSGGEEDVYLLQLLLDAWKQKKETVRQLAEEGSAKMVLPMMMIFVGIGILVLVPSVFSIMSIKVF